MAFRLVPILALLASPALTHPAFGQITELARFDSPTPFDSSNGLVVNRSNELATVWSGMQQPKELLLYTASGLQQQTVTNEDNRVWSFDFGNWGTAILFDRLGQDDDTIEAAPLGQPFTPIFTKPSLGTVSELVINDPGAISFLSRDTNHTGNRKVWLAPPAGEPELLPDLQVNAFLSSLLIDDQSRLVAAAEFLSPDYRADAYRYTPGVGWENLTESFPAPVLQIGINGSTNNAQGDFTFLSDLSQVVNLFRTDTGTITELGSFSKSDGTPSFIKTALADTGEILVAAGRNLDFDPFRGFYRQADGTELTLASLLPAGYSFPIIPQTDLNHIGDLLFEGQNDLTGKSSFFVFDGTGPVAPVPALQELDHRFESVILSDNGQVYFWQDQGDETILGTTAVPEPATAALALVGLFVGLVARHACVPRREEE